MPLNAALSNETNKTTKVDLNFLPEIRQKTGISVEIIAEIAGISPSEYRLYEAGKKDLPASTLYLVSTLLTGDPFALFDV